MKRTMTLLVLAFLFSGRVLAGTTIGNGGNGVVCMSQGKTAVELLDYYELRLNGGTLQLNSSLTTYVEILIDLFKRWDKVAPQRMGQYSHWLIDFPADAGIYSGVQIPAIPDTGTIAIPAGCELKPIAFQRPDSEVLPGIKRYTINKDYWDLMPESQKAGLVLHELIYRESIKVGHTTSFPTRYFNGYLASSTPRAETYTSIVSQLPLAWVEYGGGMVLNLGPPASEDQENKPFKIFLPFGLDGYFKTSEGTMAENVPFKNIQKFHGNIDTDNLKIIRKGEYDSGNSIFEFFRTFLRVIVPEDIVEFYVKLDGAAIAINTFPSKSMRGIKVSTSFCELYVAATWGDDWDNPKELQLDPSKSWVRNHDGTIISSIEKIQRVNSPIRPEDYGTVLTTSTGEVWRKDPFRPCQGYIKQ